MRAKNLCGVSLVGQNAGKKGTKWERLYKISVDPYFAQNFAFPKWLQTNLAYIDHIYFVPRSQLVSKTTPSISLHYPMW
jgi:hypothetical protein